MVTYGVNDYATCTALDDHLCLRFDGRTVIRAEQNAIIASCALVFVPE